VLAREVVRCDEARDPAADDGDAQAARSLAALLEPLFEHGRRDGIELPNEA
jgi:hypothetical protein